ncbi:MAG: type III PLP-dependent enzyme [Roseovarius sp.]
MRERSTFSTPQEHIARVRPDAALFYFAPKALQAAARRFQAGFPGLVSYAVKANPEEAVLANLAAAGISAFDVASREEMRAVRAVCPGAVLHYNNPVRSVAEVAAARAVGVVSCSVDAPGELAKLAPLPRETEIAVRLALPVTGGAYDFGEKFGAGPEAATELLRQVAAMGFRPAITFHPGTQCAAPSAWGAYIAASAQVARAAGVRVGRLNVGGGFAAHRSGQAPDLEAIFGEIGRARVEAFGHDAPALVCEPGRAMVAEAVTLCTRVKALRESGAVFLNDGLYGGLHELRDMPCSDRLRVLAPDGTPRRGEPVARVVFGPTCDSVDRLPGEIGLPADMEEGDYVLFDGLGAYAQSLATGFNGYGPGEVVTVAALEEAPLADAGEPGRLATR